MPARRRNKSSTVQPADPRKKKKKSKTNEYISMALTELRDLVLVIAAAIVILGVGSVIQIYFYNGEDTLGYYPKNTPELVSCNSCVWETVGPLNVITSGDKNNEMLIFLHGFPETAYLAWNHQIEYFANMGYFVVAPDQRGYNNSAKFDSISDYHLDYLSQDIIDIIDHYGKEKASVVGHDWGAAVAWHLGQFHEDRIQKLVVINVPHPQVFKSTLMSSTEQLSNSWYIFFFQLPFIPELKIARSNYEWLTGVFTMAPKGTFSKETIELYKSAWSVEGAARGMVNWYRAAILGSVFHRTTPKRVENIPTLMIWGDQDKALKASMAQPSIEMCDNGKLVMLEGISHWVPNEAPERVNSLISDFLI